MAIHRAGTYKITIKTPEPPSEYSSIRITWAQGQRIVIEKTNADSDSVTITDDSVVAVLTQEETLLFAPSVGSPMGGGAGQTAFVQIRCYKNATDAPASAVWPIPVYDSLYQEVMG